MSISKVSIKEFLPSLLEGKQLFVRSARRETEQTLSVMESRPLIHLVEKGGFFWGVARQEALPNAGIRRGFPLSNNFFCVTNVKDVFATWYESRHLLQLLPSYRYSFFSFDLRNCWGVLWDSRREDDDISPVCQAIEQGKRFQVAILDGEDVWNVHPVSLAVHEENIFFELRTEYITYPLLFRSPKGLEGLMSKNKVAFPRTFEEYKGETLSWRDLSIWPSFYSLRSDGTYYNAFDIPRGTVQKYKRLVVFSA